MIKKRIKYIRILLNPVAFERDRAKLQAQIQKKDKQIEALQREVESSRGTDAKLQVQAQKKDEPAGTVLPKQTSTLQPKASLKHAVEQYVAGELEAAEAFLEQVSPEDPRYGAALTRFARVAMKRKDWAEALRWWEAKLASQRDDFAHVFIEMSAAYRNQGMIDKAINLLNGAQERGLANNPLRFQLARLLAQRAEWKKAADLISSIIAEDETFSHNVNFATLAARIFWHVGDIRRASMIMERAITKNVASGFSAKTTAIANEIRRRFQASSKLNGLEVSKSYYDDIYQESQKYGEPGEGSVYLGVWREIANRINREGYARILDIGCGPGQFAEHLIQRCPSIEYTGLDFSKVAINAAKRRCPSATFIEADAFHPDLLGKGEYDLVLMLELLEHVENDLALLNRIPVGKTVMFSVPNFDSFAHVRFFPTEEAVSERYGPCFLDLKVMAIALANESAIFLGFGVKSDREDLSGSGCADLGKGG